jgi:hypothetical protein
MLIDILVAAVMLLCLLGLAHGMLPAARQQHINRQLSMGLRRAWAALQHAPAAWRSRAGQRSARDAAQAAIERARREAAGAQVHDLARFRQQRDASGRAPADPQGKGSSVRPDRLH